MRAVWWSTPYYVATSIMSELYPAEAMSRHSDPSNDACDKDSVGSDDMVFLVSLGGAESLAMVVICYGTGR